MRKPPEKPSPREVLSANLKRLMEAHPGLSTIKKVAQRSTLSNGKVGRIYAASHTTDIDALRQIAHAFDLEPWQLLVEGLNPDALPALAGPDLLHEIRRLVTVAQRESSLSVIDETDRELVQGDAGSVVSSETPALKGAMDVSGVARSKPVGTARRASRKIQKPKRGRRA